MDATLWTLCHYTFKVITGSLVEVLGEASDAQEGVWLNDRIRLRIVLVHIVVLILEGSFYDPSDPLNGLVQFASYLFTCFSNRPEDSISIRITERTKRAKCLSKISWVNH